MYDSSRNENSHFEFLRIFANSSCLVLVISFSLEVPPKQLYNFGLTYTILYHIPNIYQCKDQYFFSRNDNLNNFKPMPLGSKVCFL